MDIRLLRQYREAACNKFSLIKEETYIHDVDIGFFTTRKNSSRLITYVKMVVRCGMRS
jgi:hypothetical protein